MNELIEYAELVERMRLAQKLFIKTKNMEMLRESIDLERQVDEATDRILEPTLLENVTLPHNPDIGGEG